MIDPRIFKLLQNLKPTKQIIVIRRALKMVKDGQVTVMQMP
jgi:hypothetical protein